MNIANLQTLDWDDLRVFNAIVGAGSLSGAAEQLGVNHSTVFRRLRRLEQSMGARLFDRLPQGYVLTTAGHTLAEHSGRIGEEIDTLELRLLGRDYRPSGTIRVTAPDNIAYNYLPRHFETFRARYPDIRIELIVGAASLDLSRREADIAVRATSKPPEHLVGRQVCRFAWSFYAAPAYLEAMGRVDEQSRLEGHRLIAAEGSLTRLPALQWIDRNAAHQVVARCNTLNGIAALALSGLGIALLPDDQMRPGLERLFQLTPRVTSDLWVLTHPELRRTERIRLLMHHLSEELGDENSRLRQAPG
ncbi:LysR family transcriptional regulator [Elongatibacter sediminis]|uniref:LysR family transcriptional regulator n=1 Tax=Elongatibacter sediminis TaxID=3119006 RepID=A0AAW9RJF2_9GAMM